MFMSERNLEIYKDSANCPVRNILSRLGDKWSLLTLMLLGEVDKMRFNELHKTIGDISQKMLTVTLRSLEADDLVKRTVYPEIPPRVEYEITKRAQSLLPHMKALTKWAVENMSDIQASRRKYGSKVG